MVVVVIAVIMMLIIMFKPSKPTYTGKWEYRSNLNMESGVMVDYSYINIKDEGECSVQYNTTGQVVYGTWEISGEYAMITLNNGSTIRAKLRDDGSLLVNRQYIFEQ